MGGSYMFEVTVHYTEPLYRLYRKLPPKVYTCRSKVDAEDFTEALSQALAIFKLTTQQSSVGWLRKVVRVEVAHIGAEARQAS